jgi:hypothetical protein
VCYFFLQLPVPEGEESSGVTPQIFARPLVAAVVAHINKLVKKEVHGLLWLRGCCTTHG